MSLFRFSVFGCSSDCSLYLILSVNSGNPLVTAVLWLVNSGVLPELLTVACQLLHNHMSSSQVWSSRFGFMSRR